MVKKEWLAIAAMVAMCPGVALAQQTSMASDQKTKPAPAKTTKVWTEDDISSVRTPADDYMDQQRAAASDATSTAASSKPAQTSAAKPQESKAPARLSNPKTVESADEMIAWEQRDIDSQQEYLQKLQNQLATAPDSQKAHLQAWIDQEIKTIADTKNEQAGLIAQKKDLEKKASSADAGKTNPQQQ